MRHLISFALVFLLSSNFPVRANEVLDESGVIVVEGEASIFAVPDILVIEVWIRVPAQSGENTFTQYQTSLETLIDQVSAHGVSRENVSQVWFEMGSRTPNRRIEEYWPSVDGYVLVRAPVSSRNGELVDVIQRDTNAMVLDLEFERANKAELISKAEEMAVKNALEKISEFAAASSMMVKEIVRIGPEPRIAKAEAEDIDRSGVQYAPAMRNSVPIMPGELEFKGTIEVKARLVPAN